MSQYEPTYPSLYFWLGHRAEDVYAEWGAYENDPLPDDFEQEREDLLSQMDEAAAQITEWWRQQDEDQAWIDEVSSDR